MVYRDTIPGSNFKSLFKSMVSYKQNYNQVDINEFFRTLRCLNVTKNEISSDPLKIKYSNVLLYRIHQRHLTSIKYKNENEDDNEKKVRPLSLNH